MHAANNEILIWWDLRWALHFILVW